MRGEGKAQKRKGGELLVVKDKKGAGVIQLFSTLIIS